MIKNSGGDWFSTIALGLAFDHREWAFAIVIVEQDQICGIVRGTIGHDDFDTNPFRGVFVAMNQLSIILRANLFFGIGPALGLIDGDITNAVTTTGSFYLKDDQP